MMMMMMMIMGVPVVVMMVVVVTAMPLMYRLFLRGDRSGCNDSLFFKCLCRKRGGFVTGIAESS